MHRGIAILAALLLGGCMHVFQDGRAEGVPVVVEVPPPEETQQLAELVLSAQRFSRASAEQQKRELAAANKAFAADKRNVLARLRLGMLLSLPGTAIQDQARALALLEPFAEARNGDNLLKQFGALLYANLAEHAKAQRRADQLKEQLEALRAVERSIIDRGLESQPRKP